MKPVIRSEIFKFRTTPGPWIILGITMALTALFALGSFRNFGQWTVPTSQMKLRHLIGAGLFPAVFTAPILGVLCITGEYRHKVITTTLLFTPQRERVLIAKAVATIVWAVFLCLATLVTVAIMAGIWFTSAGGSFSPLFGQVGAVVPGLLADFALLALFGLGFGILVRNQVAGVLFTIGGTLIVEIFIIPLYFEIFNSAASWVPFQAAAALAGGLLGGARGPSAGAFALLPWWGGGLALLAWGVVPAVVGYFTTFRRDVT